MKKVLLLSASFILLIATSFGQTIIYEDDFESYTVGEYLAEQSADWTTWSGAPGTAEDALISDDQAASPTKSVVVDGTTDLVKPLGDKTSGTYEVNFWYYVPTGYYGYYNIQHFEQPGVEWALEVFFEDGGTGYINAGGASAATFVYTPDAWVEVVNHIDLTNDWAELYIEGVLVYEWQFSLQASGGAGTLQLGGVNHYAWNASGDPMYYFDDYVYQQIPDALYCDDFEEYIVDDYLCTQSDWWTTWSGTPGGDDDAFISDDQSHSPDQSVLIEGASDLIGPFGDQVSGAYQIDFWMYIPSGYGGYYNLQHFEAPGVEWAMEVYFGEIGEGYLITEGENTYFDYDHDTWFFISNIVDLDNDLAELFIDGVSIHEWQWSTQASGGSGANQLGGIDIYAGAPTGETPMFYVDDFCWYQLSVSNDPQISVSPSSFTKMINMGNVEQDILSVENVGAADLEWYTEIQYNADGKKSTPYESGNQNPEKSKLVKLSLDPKPGNFGTSNPTDDVILKYDDGVPASSIGYTTGGGSFQTAAKFTNAIVKDYIGMDLTSIEVAIADINTVDFAMHVYGEGDAPFNPGEMYLDEPFFPAEDDFYWMDLTDPVKITGEDIWVGYEVTFTADETYPAAVDAGPADPNGDWIKSGVAWGSLGFDQNWVIHAILTGVPSIQWLSVDPVSGTTPPGELDDLTVTFDATELEMGSYSATIQVNSNSVVDPIVNVPVNLAVIVGINEVGENNAIMTYPNPATDVLNIKANHTINNVKVINYVGQIVYNLDSNDEFVKINTSELTPGMYILQINTESGMTTQQVVIK